MSHLTSPQESLTPAVCKNYVLPIRDVLDLIGGKWRLPIILVLAMKPMHFKELERHIEKITPRMLSKELKDLEINQLVYREVKQTSPVTVEYSLTAYGRSLDTVINTMRDWGIEHRKRIISK